MNTLIAWPPQIDPVAFTVGAVTVRWYGLMYLVGFAIVLVLGRRRARDAWRAMSAQELEELLFVGLLGVVVGGRLGHILFYGPPSYYLAHPGEIFAIWKGGTSSHGGILSVVVGLAVWTRVRGKSFLRVADFLVPLVPLALGAGRIGNFINGELWGRPADPAAVPWAMVFPRAGDGVPRHPSQLYEAALEGGGLFVLLWMFSRRPRTPGVVGAAFLTGYGVLRIIGEQYREPESLYGAMPLGLSAGQLLSLPMVVLGVALMWHYSRRHAA